MTNNVMAVYDKDEEYVMRLMNYFSETRPVDIEIQGFTDLNYLKDYASEKRLDVLLIQDSQMCADIEEMKIGKIMVLSEGEYEAEDGKGHKTIYKYQSTENILREVMCYYAEEPPVHLGVLNGTKSRLIGVYSPVKRSLKTSFALCLGQILSHSRKTLYIDIEDYHGFNYIMNQNFMADISDLLFYIQQSKKNFPCKLASVVQRMGSLDYIPPAISPEDIKQVKAEEWMQFLNEVTDCNYDYVILDIGDSVREIRGILNVCETIYTPVREDFISRAKLEQYETWLRIMECEDLLKKTEKLSFPFFNDLEGPPENLENTSLGDHIRAMLE